MDTLSRGISTSCSMNGLQQFDTRPEGKKNSHQLLNGCQLDHLFSTAHEDDSPVEGDYFDGVFKYLQQMLMDEDDLADKPCMFQDCLALQAAEKSFYEALNHNPIPPPPVGSLSRCPSITTTTSNSTYLGIQCLDSPVDDFAEICPFLNDDVHVPLKTSVDQLQPHVVPCTPPPCSSDLLHVDYLVDHCLSPSQTIQSNGFLPKGKPFVCYCPPYEETPDINVHNQMACNVVSGEKSSNCSISREKISNHNRPRGGVGDDDDDDEGEEDRRSRKQFASCNQEDNIHNTEDYDNALLCPARDPNFYGESPPPAGRRNGGATSAEEEPKKPQYVPPKTAKRGRPRAGSKRQNIREVVDLRDVLTRCANAAANFNSWEANELLKKVRQHSSPYGDPTERLAHCFGNALEARIAGMGSTMYTSLTTKRASAADILKAYQTYLGICPFQRMSNIFANKNIAKITSTATRVHIIDFGILYGFQWPCLLHGISLRPGGPPKLRITGIDLPQPGFRPAERIEETGRRLANYAKRFNVPFEFNVVAKRWDAITEEDLMIDDKDSEMLVVNCLYRMRNVSDEIITQSSPRDCVMNLIRKLNPVLFVHGVLNGTYNAPFFETRFKEAMYHFSSLFDMLEETLPREDHDRMMFEKEVMGKDVMNVVACEGTERVERPDTYKQWNVKNMRAGFKPLPLDPAIMREVKFKTKAAYHKEFLVDEHNNWMLQGWKGRVLYALSCWQPS